MGWQYLQASGEIRKIGNELSKTHKLLQREKIKGFLTSAITEIQHRQFNLSLVDTSRFFNALSNEVNKPEQSAYRDEEKILLKKIFEDRDMTIASIARREDGAVEKLTQIYLFYLRATGEFRKSGEEKTISNQKNDEGNANIIENSTNTNTENQNASNKNANLNVENNLNVDAQNTNKSDVNGNENQ